jgi:hypothetical protein
VQYAPRHGNGWHRVTRLPNKHLEPILGVGDAWSFVKAADAAWDRGDQGWAVQFDDQTTTTRATTAKCVSWRNLNPALASSRGQPVNTPEATPKVTRVSEYEGQAAVRIAATQLGTEYTAAQAKRVVTEWEAFFSAGPSPIRELEFVSRTPRRLFEALSGQTQLRSLNVKWGDFADLRPLTGMTELRTLRLRGASAVQDLRPLAGLVSVQDLQVEGLRRVSDLSPVGSMTGVTALELGGDWMTPRVLHVESFGFLRRMSQLRQLLLHTIAADDLDYTPILDLPNLTSVRVMETRGMRPSLAVLEAQTPWSG